MDGIFKDITDRGIGAHTLDAYLVKLKSAIDEAYTAAENGSDLTAMVKIGESKSYLDAVLAVWEKLTDKK